jgi:HK97 family phage prohead protease
MTLLERSASFTASATGDGQQLSGYAAVFDQMTEIDSWEGTFQETIRRGAFRKTIRERTPVLQFDHGRHPLVGSIPIGSIESLSEDEQGLAVEARLTDNWLIQPVRDAIANGSVNGMSFRFEVIRDEWRDNAGKLIKPDELMSLLWDAGDRGPIVRTLVEVKCAELGPVVFPAYAGTSVDVRAKELSVTIFGNREISHDVRKSLAEGLSLEDANLDGTLNNEQLRGEVAKAVLFRHLPVKEDEPVTDDHPSEPETRDEPVEESHPSPDINDTPVVPERVLQTDAPLSGEHPSKSTVSPERIRASANFMRDYMGLIMKGADRYER